MKRYNIVNPKKYTQDGQEKTRWAEVGTMIIFEKNGKESVIIDMHDQKEAFQAFEQKPKDSDLPF